MNKTTGNTRWMSEDASGRLGPMLTRWGQHELGLLRPFCLYLLVGNLHGIEVLVNNESSACHSVFTRALTKLNFGNSTRFSTTIITNCIFIFKRYSLIYSIPCALNQSHTIVIIDETVGSWRNIVSYLTLTSQGF